jgi:hypothetical protein
MLAIRGEGSSCRDHPGRLWSLLDMLRFYARPFLRLAKMIGAGRAALDFNPKERGTVIPDEVKVADRASYVEVRRDCIALGLDSAIDQLNRVDTAFERSFPLITFGELDALETELANRITDELERALLLHVGPSVAKYYGLTSPFGEVVSVAFPDSIIDTEEAGNCLALGRDTACVMHLMRVMESGIAALAKSLNVAADFKTWDTVIKKLRAELEVSYPQMDPAMKGKRDFYAHSFDRLTAVKDALRNPTMHARVHYDPSRAEEVYRAVRSFMQLLAEQLTEVDP